MALFDLNTGSTAQPDTGFDLVTGGSGGGGTPGVGFDMVTGSATQPDSGFSMVSGGFNPPTGSLLSMEIPTYPTGTCLLAIVVRDVATTITPAGWTKVVDELGVGDVFLDAYARTVDGTEESEVLFLALIPQEMQGGLVALSSFTTPVTVIETTDHHTLDDRASLDTPRVLSLQSVNTVLHVWSVGTAVTLTPPDGYTVVDTFSTAEVGARSILIAYAKAGTAGFIESVAASATVVGDGAVVSGRSFTLVLHYNLVRGHAARQRGELITNPSGHSRRT